MKLIGALALCCLPLSALAGQANCQIVQKDQIRAADMVKAIPAFASIPPEVILGSSPLPGSMRSFRNPELASIAQHYSLTIDSAIEVCFVWEMAPINHEKILNAMRDALHNDDARIEIEDTTVGSVPQGTLTFDRKLLPKPASMDSKVAVLWRGDVVYGGTHRYPIWTRVKIGIPCERLIAQEILKLGRPVQKSQLRSEPGECFPDARSSALTLETAVGLLPLRYIVSGSDVRADLLVVPNDINRGDLIQVEVLSGSAHLTFTGRAESGGREGDVVAVRNPDSNKLFRAQISGKGKATLQAGPN